MKHKTFTLILLLITAGFVAEAHPVDMRTAREVAMKFVNANAKTPLSGADELQLVTTYNISRGDAAFHVFNTPNGFVIVSADDCAYPILGYSDEGRQFDVNNVPIQLQDILREYSEQIQYAVENNLQPDEATAQQWRLVKATGRLSENRDRTQVGPLLTTTWDQGQYYNAMCPEDANGPDGHCVTGCVATAMAQIIKYYGYPQNGRGVHCYEGTYGELSVNFEESNYDYSSMPDALTNESSDAQVNAVAKLISDCGIAVNMGYSAGESSSYDQEARAALINFFKFSPNLSFAEKSFFTSDEWSAMLQADLDSSRPVYYSGRGSGGHAFVCDGYNTDGYYHFNFGWSGAGNEWYLLDAVNPLGTNFNSNQAAILGIIPDANGNVILGQMTGTSTFTVDEPLEFYHMMGHNLYDGNDYTNYCNNTVNFIPVDSNNQMVADIMEFNDQQLIFRDGNDNMLRTIIGGDSNNDLNPIVSEANALKITYIGNLFYNGFKVILSQNSDCRMVSNVVSLVENTTVHLSWTENGNATQWDVEYGLEGFVLGSGVMASTDEPETEITGLTEFVTYDFYIRPACGGSWYGPTTLTALAPYWVDVVTTQPAGYSMDSEGNVTISSAEGLAWWAKLADNEHRYWRWLVFQEPFVPTIEGLDENMMQNGWCMNRPTTITTDIDLAGYRWKPIHYSADIDGQMHTISNMLIYEDASLEPEPYYGFLSGFSGPSQIGFTIKDILFQDPVINCPTGYYGVLVGMVFSANIRNIGVNNAVINQYSSSPFVSIYNVYGVAGGGLIGHAESTNIDNCYVTGNIVSEYPYYGVNNGGIVGYAESSSTINNNYSSVQMQSRTGGLGGICAFANGLEMRNCYGIDDYPILGHNDLSNGGISDTLQFDKNTQQLNGTVYFDDESCSTLLEALNMRVVYENNETWMTWTTDVNVVNDGLPVFSEPYIVTCPNTQNIVAVNVIINNQNALSLTWDDNDGVTQWRVKCVEKDAPDNTAQYYLKNDNSITITDLTLDKVYKIFVMPICDDTNQGGWGAGIEHVYDKPYWTDFVTTQPDGYVIDNDGNVTITSREGFVWFSCLVNGLHGQEYQSFRGKHIHLTTDVDLSQYRWMPIGNTWWNQFEGSFDGGDHTISNVYVNEYHDWVGLFGHVFQSQILNVTLENSIVTGYSNVGAICGFYQNNDGWWDIWNYGPVMFDNCQIVNTSVYGDQLVGALVGRVENWIETTITNCSASGEVHGSYYVGGLIGNIKDYATIGNCYSTCDIYATDTDAGGLIGFSKNCVVENSYATGTITSTGGSYGKLIGYLCENITCHYLYGLEDENPINLFGFVGDNCTIDNSKWFNSAGVMENAVIIGTASYDDLLDALNAWVIEQDESSYRTWDAGDNGLPVFGNYYEPVVIPYWTEIVTEQPEGYVIDDEGNILISSPEGLAWLSKIMETNYEFEKYHVLLTADINLNGYKWKPIKQFSGVFDGQGHRIDSMYAVEREFEATALFNNIHSATIKNVFLTNCCSRQLQYQSAGGLVASVFTLPDELFNDTIMNCFVSGMVEGHGGAVAPIVGFLGKAVIINCASNCVVKGGDSYGMLGGIAGDGLNGYGGVIRNCYSASTIISQAAWQGYALGYGIYTIVENCYGFKARNGLIPIAEGAMMTLSDNTWFDSTDNDYSLLEPIFFEPDNQYYSNLKEALNAGVRKYNLSGLRLWVDDVDGINEGMPILGPEYMVTCPNVQKLTAKNVLGANSDYGVKLSWIETGEALEWEIKYHVQGDTAEIRTQASTNPYSIFGLTEQTTYCFSVRPRCSSTDIGGWSEEVSIVIDRPYWTDMVTSQPDGYLVDNSGNVTIASAEGLAWLASVTNGLNGEIAESFENKSIVLTQDIDIGQYKWTAINGFSGVFDAREHVINGLYVNELSDNQGLFGRVLGGNYLNVVLENADVRGRNCVGMLIGYAGNITVINSRVSGSVYGQNEVGGMLGRNEYGELVDACSSSGTVEAVYDVAGGLIGIAGRANGEQTEYNIRNSFSRCEVTAGRYDAGGLVGACNADIDNCYATGDVNGYLYNGGLTASFGQLNLYSALNNSYYGGTVSRTDYYAVNNCSMGFLFGTITSTTYGNPEISNCYSLFDGITPYQLIGPSSDVDENCNVLGSPIVSNTVPFAIENNSNTLMENITIGQTSYYDLLDALNAWVDANNTNGEYLHWVADTAMVNGGFPILEQLPATTMQTAELASGWSWYSTYIEQEGIDGLAMLENSMDTACTRIQSRTEFIDNLEYMGYHFWDGTLSAITNEQSYRIRTTSPCEAVITGQPALPENHPITVNPGWNWIGFPSAQPLSLTSALSAFAPEVNDQIKGRYNFATYLGNYGGVDYWDGMLTTLEPGQGYMYRSYATTAKTLVYQTGSKGEIQVNGSTEGNVYQPASGAYADNMTVTAEIELNGSALRRAQGPESFELAAFVGDECRGSVKLRYVEPLDRYEAFLMVFGDGGEELRFVLTDGEETYWSNDRVVFSANAILGNPAEPYVVRFGSTSVSDKLTQSLRVYPNPVERGERFSIGMNDSEERPVRVEIVNALGALVKAETLSQWPTTLVAPATAGVYTLKIVVDDKTAVCRRLVVK